MTLRPSKGLATKPAGTPQRRLPWACLLLLGGLVLSPAASPTRSQQDSAAKSRFEEVARRADEARVANRLEDALGLYQQALALNPRWDEGWWYLGMLEYEGDHYADALPAFRNLVGLTPKYGPGWALMGLCEFETKDYKNALVHLQYARSLGLQGNEELVNVIRYHEALLLILKGEFEGATELLNTMVARGEVSNSVKRAMGLALLRVPLLPDQVDPSKDALVHDAGDVAEIIASANLEQAEAAFRQLLKDYPNTPFLHYAYGSVLVSLSRYDDAAQAFRAEMKITPESALPYMELAYVYLRVNRFQDALPLGEQAVKRAPQSFAAHYLLGRTLFELGLTEASIRELELARRLGPFSPEVRYSLARAYAKAHRNEEAARERAEFARLNALLQRRQQQSESQSYRSSGDRGALEPHSVQESAGPPPR